MGLGLVYVCERNFCFRTVDPLVYYMIQIWLFVFWVVFLFLIVVSVSVSAWFGAFSMLFIVKLQHS